MSANEWCDARQHHSTDSIHNNYTQVAQHIITFVNKRPKGFGKDCIECTPPSPHRGGSGPPSNTMFARSLRVFILNETSILSAVIAHQSRVKLHDRQTDRNIGSNRLHLRNLMQPNNYSLHMLGASNPVWVPGLGIDPLGLLAGCRKRRLNQTALNLRGLI